MKGTQALSGTTLAQDEDISVDFLSTKSFGSQVWAGISCDQAHSWKDIVFGLGGQQPNFGLGCLRTGLDVLGSGAASDLGKIARGPLPLVARR